MHLLAKIFNEFKAGDSFKNNPYGWVTNQIGHVSLSFVLCYLVNNGLFTFSLLFIWLAWEVYHLIESRDIFDFIEDLYFEWVGVLIYIFGDKQLYICIFVLITLFIYRVYKKE